MCNRQPYRPTQQRRPALAICAAKNRLDMVDSRGRRNMIPDFTAHLDARPSMNSDRLEAQGCRVTFGGWEWLACTSSCSQLVEQGLGLFQIERVEALGEPAVGRREQVMRLGALALFGQKARKRCGGAELPGFGALLT